MISNNNTPPKKKQQQQRYIEFTYELNVGENNTN